MEPWVDYLGYMIIGCGFASSRNNQIGERRAPHISTQPATGTTSLLDPRTLSSRILSPWPAVSKDTACCPQMPNQRSMMLAVISVAAGLLPRSAAFLPAPTAAWKRSPSLHASTTTGTNPSTRDRAAAAADAAPAGSSVDEPAAGGRPVEPTGIHHPLYSLSPLIEGRRWALRDGQYFNELIKANGGASVFKGHPGLAVTFLTDHASCEWFFSQPQSVLDRQVRGVAVCRPQCHVSPL